MKQHCPIVVCLKDSKTGKFTNCGPTLCPDSKNLHLPNGYSAPPGNNSVNWLGNNPHQPSGATGYNGGSLPYLPGHSYNAPSTNSAQVLSSGEKLLETRIAQKALPYVQKLAPWEISLGMYTFSHLGRSAKDGDGLSLQIKGCFAHMEAKGGIDMLRMFLFQECNLSDNDMSLFGNWLARYSVYLKHLDFSQNQVGDLGVKYLFNSAFTVPTGPSVRLVVNLDLSNNKIGDEGAAHISAYIKGGYLPALKALNVSGNQITPTGYGHFVGAMNSPQTQDIAIVLEKHKNKNAVLEFITKGSNHYLKQFMEYIKNFNIGTTFIKTDEDSAFMYCKKAVPDAVVGLTLGIAKCTNPIAKLINSLPQPGEKISFTNKFIGKLSVWTCVISEEGENIFTPETLGCAAEFNMNFEVCTIL